jgi:hypothetical protein
MDRLSRLGYVLLALLFLVPAFRVMFDFFGISMAVYMPYLLWLVALILFYGFLPSTVGEMFN